jgi:hypothetical protein
MFGGRAGCAVVVAVESKALDRERRRRLVRVRVGIALY